MKKTFYAVLAALGFLLVSVHGAKQEEKAPEPEKSPRVRLQYQTIQLVLNDLEQAGNAAEREKLLDEILEQTDVLLKEVPKDPMVWAWRAEAALQLDRWQEGVQCAQKLLELDVLNDTDNLKMMNLMAQLNRRGWLETDTSKVEYTELIREVELKSDDELPESIKAALGEVVSAYASGDFWGGYNKIKGIRLEIGPEEAVRYPLARRALSASLAVAAARDDMSMVRSALACGGNPGDKMNAQPAIMWAAGHNNANMVRLLAAAGADVNVKNKYGHSILLDPVMKNNLRTLEMLLEAGADPNGRGRKGPLLLETIMDDRLDAAAILIRNGAEVNGVRLDDGRPLLLLAIQSGDKAFVSALLDAGANPKEEYQGRDLYYLAKKQSSKEIADMVKDAGKKR